MQRKSLPARIEELQEAPRLSNALAFMPGIGVRTGTRSLTDVGHGSSFPSAAYAGLAAATRSSGSSIRDEPPSLRGNKQLKRAFFLFAFAALAHPASHTQIRPGRSQAQETTDALDPSP
ncbi:transposase [Streptomyces sp. NPDC008343]|uniref:transposase n=1 Tax=Streptomyces sp. NPDC008343 TaxID=3364828 RepID=UPI0036E4EFAC